MNHKNVIREFLEKWLKWVNAGAKKDKVLSRRMGLCVNLRRYMSSLEMFDAGEMSAISHEFYLLLGKQRTPFNDNENNIVYANEANAGIMHLNAKRLAWARIKLKELSQ